MSPFLREINPGLYELFDPAPAFADSPVHSYSGGLPDPLSEKRKNQTVQSARAEFAAGMMVKHPFFGIGTITAVPAPRRVEVHFDRHGDKSLHLDYAKLEVLT
jgi:DNA helicase-2/ATP-dependent DNA helicase PcrA